MTFECLPISDDLLLSSMIESCSRFIMSMECMETASLLDSIILPTKLVGDHYLVMIIVGVGLCLCFLVGVLVL